nr:hypothetical protein [Tanacetum cinerariifolium]
MSSVRTPQQNGVVERRNQTLVEAARTMLIFSHAPLFLWAKAIATTKLDISFLHVFEALCYPKNDREDIGKLGAKGDIGFFIGYSADSCDCRVSKPRLQTMYDDYIGGQPSATARTVPAAQEPQDVDELNSNTMVNGYTFVNPFANPSTSAAELSSSQNVDPSNMHMFYQPYPHEFQWTKDNPLEQVIGEPSRYFNKESTLI